MKKKSCILHLGTPKTGTTALQFGLAGYDDGETVYAKIPTSPDNPNQSEPLVFAGLNTRAIQHYSKIYPKWRTDEDKMTWPNAAVMKFILRTGHPPDPLRYRAALSKSIADVPHRRLIFSGEGLFSNFDSAEGLVQLLKDHFENIEAICYVRPCAAAHLSRFQQRLAAPNQAAFFSDGSRLDLNRQTFRDAEYLACWKKALEGESLQTAVYARGMLKNGDVLDDFCERLRLDATRAFHTRSNVSFSAEATAVMALFAYFGSAPQGNPNFGRNKRFFDLLMSQFGTGKLGLSDAFADRLFKANSDALDWMDKECGQAFERAYSRGSHTIDRHEDLFAIAEDILPEFIGFMQEKAGARFADLPRDARGFATKLSEILCEPVAFPDPFLPQNFDAEQYLVLNPDIARAGLDAGQHFREHGCFEGRFY